MHVLVDQLLLLREQLHLGRLVRAIATVLRVRGLLGRRNGGVLDELFGVEGLGRGDFQS